MISRVLLNLLNELKKPGNMQGLLSSLLLFEFSLINSIIQEYG